MPLPSQKVFSTQSADLSRLPFASLLCAIALLLGVALARGQAGSAATAPGNGARSGSDLMREGTELIDSRGHFKQVGDRVVYFAEDSRHPMVALENLALERVARTITDNPNELPWSVSGVVVEFRGTNYLLVRRAILRMRPDPVASTTASMQR